MLHGRGIEPLLLKGRANKVWLWAEGGGSGYGDVDLLVEPERFADVGKILADVGFTVTLDDSDLPGQLPHGHHWVRDGDCIDLHRAIFGAEKGPRVCWDALWRDHETIEIGWVEVAVPSIPARALHVAVHAIQHPGSLDEHTRGALERAIEISDAATWEAAAELAVEIGATAAFDAGLRRVPAGAEIAARLDLRYEPTAAVLRSQLGRPPGVHGIDQMVAAAGLRARTSIALRKLFPSRRLMRAWSPLARRGTAGLTLAYLWRPLWVIGRLPGAVIARARARR